MSLRSSGLPTHNTHPYSAAATRSNSSTCRSNRPR
jgi:hypothetical protein